MTDDQKQPDQQESDSEPQKESGGNGDKDNKPEKGSPQPPPPVKIGRGLMSWVLIISLLIILFIALNSSGRGNEIKSWNEFVHLVDPDAEKLKDNIVLLEDSRIVAQLKPGTVGFPASEEGPTIYVKIDGTNRNFYLTKLDELGVDHEAHVGTSIWMQILVSFAPFLLLILIIWFFIARSMRSAGGGPGGMLGNFGKSRHRIATKDTSKMNFGDVAGIDEPKEELEEIVEFLKNPKRFQRLGGRIPRGVLLIGPPGCGKTLLAKAIAGEADVPFFSISGSDFVEMFVGVGASRVRDLFKQAKENSPCIIFLDEIDAVGRKRGQGFSSGGHDEREQTLNAILVEMDGFEANDQVIVIAATNRADVLDPALTRPGRFDRQVTVPLPDLLGRKLILEVHVRNLKVAPDTDLERVARVTPMFSGADLAALCNEAAILATMANKDYVELPDFEEARDKIRFGRAQKSRRIEENERIATAYHEAGHAVIQSLLDDADPVHKVTIIPRGQALGATFSLPEKDRYGFGLKFLQATMRVLCGGRIAEQRKTKDISSGAGMDIQMATRYARHMILEWGMSDRLGFVNYAGADSNEMFIADKDYSDDTARIIDEEVKRFIDEAYSDADKIIDKHWKQVSAIAEALLKYETLQGEEVRRLLDGERIDKPTITELLHSETEKPKDKKPKSAKSKDEPELPPDAVPSPA